MHPRTHTHSFYVNDHTVFCILVFIFSCENLETLRITVKIPHSWLITAQCQYSII